MGQERDKKGMFSSPEDKQIGQESEELLGLYLHSLKEQKPGTKETTVTTRRREVRYWLSFCEANDIDPLAATTEDVKGYIQSNTHLADTTVGSYYRSTQSFYSIVENDHLHDELVLVNGHPCPDRSVIDLKQDYRIFEGVSEYQRQHSLSANDVQGAREKSSEVLALKPEAIRQLFNHVPGKEPHTKLRNEVAVRLNWFTGARSEELAGMKIENIDWDRCCINIRSAKLNAQEHPDLVRRDVYFPERFKLQLRRWVDRVRHQFSSAVEPREGYILCTTHKPQMKSWLINDQVKNAAKNAGIQRPLRPTDPEPDEEVKEWLVTTHRVRRSAISHWVNDVDPIDLHQARRLAGHARIEQTMSYVEDDHEALGQDYQRGMQAAGW